MVAMRGLACAPEGKPPTNIMSLNVYFQL